MDDPGIGGRIRAFRRRRGRTLAELAAATGISASTLSRLESGGRRATLELLVPVARELGTGLDALAGTAPPADPRVSRRPLVRAGRTYVPLSREPGPLQAFKVLIPGARGDETPRPQVHDGVEWCYVLSGRLRLVLDGVQTVLGPGEAAEYDTTRAHWTAAAGPEPVELLSLFSRSGERVHLHTPDPAG